MKMDCVLFLFPRECRDTGLRLTIHERDKGILQRRASRAPAVLGNSLFRQDLLNSLPCRSPIASRDVNRRAEQTHAVGGERPRR